MGRGGKEGWVGEREGERRGYSVLAGGGEEGRQGYSPSPGLWYPPPPTRGQIQICENITFPHPSDESMIFQKLLRFY